jgi:hypothetical protein
MNLISNSSNRKKWEYHKTLNEKEKGGKKSYFIPIFKKNFGRKEDDKETNNYHVTVIR